MDKNEEGRYRNEGIRKLNDFADWLDKKSRDLEKQSRDWKPSESKKYSGIECFGLVLLVILILLGGIVRVFAAETQAFEVTPFLVAAWAIAVAAWEIVVEYWWYPLVAIVFLIFLLGGMGIGAVLLDLTDAVIRRLDRED